MRSNDDGRTFTVVFFTDGQPTIGETNPDKILKNVASQEHRQHAHLHLRRRRRRQRHACSTSWPSRPGRSAPTSGRAEDIEAKVSQPVQQDQPPGAGQPEADGRRRASACSEVYPPQLPDLFHGSQLVVLGRYHGTGPAAIKLTGTVGKETRGVRLRDRPSRRRPATTRPSSRTCGPAARSATCSTRSASTARRRSWSTR